MVEPNVISGAVWLVCGAAILTLGYVIAFRGRGDLHANYDESVDLAYASRWVGATALLMGLLVVGYAAYELSYGFHPTAFGGLMVSLLVLSYLTKLFARGFGSES